MGMSEVKPRPMDYLKNPMLPPRERGTHSEMEYGEDERGNKTGAKDKYPTLYDYCYAAGIIDNSGYSTIREFSAYRAHIMALRSCLELEQAGRDIIGLADDDPISTDKYYAVMKALIPEQRITVHMLCDGPLMKMNDDKKDEINKQLWRLAEGISRLLHDMDEILVAYRQ